MKTVSGHIISTKPVNLYKAANILSNFVNSDNGASQSVSAYLRRASAAFNELVYFKKHHKLKKNKKVNEESATIPDRNLEQDDVRVVENGGVNKKPDQDPVENERKEGELRNKEKKKKSGKKDYVGVEIEEANEMVKRKSEDKKKKKKTKRKNEEIDGGENGNLEAPERKKRRRIEADE